MIGNCMMRLSGARPCKLELACDRGTARQINVLSDGNPIGHGYKDGGVGWVNRSTQ